MVCFRLPRGVLDFLHDNVANVSAECRKLVFDHVEQLPGYWQVEEFRLEVEVARLIDELNSVHRWQNAVLKHGSYAEAYLNELRGGVVLDRNPFYVRKPRPDVKPEELQVVKEIVDYREALAKQLAEKLKRLMVLKKSQSSKRLVDSTVEMEVKREDAT